MTIVKDPEQEASAAIIWLHGLGASADDLVMLQTMLSMDNWPIRNVFLQAPNKPVTINQGMHMPAWYDIKSHRIQDEEDEGGILDSCDIVMAEIKQQIANGIPSERIFLAGFSQGGVISLYTALSSDMPLAGVIVLSGYLALRDLVSSMNLTHRAELPVFMSYGMYDPIINRLWTQESVKRLENKGLKNITALEYEKDHTVCASELEHLRKWLQERLELLGISLL